MKLVLRIWFVIVVSACLISSAEGAIYKYSFPKPSTDWGKPISFTNLSPGFFQVMYQDKANVLRIATYGIAGSSMDALKDPQLLMVFVFDQPLGKSPRFLNLNKK